MITVRPCSIQVATKSFSFNWMLPPWGSKEYCTHWGSSKSLTTPTTCGPMVRASVSRARGRGFKPRPGPHVMSLGKALTILHPAIVSRGISSTMTSLPGPPMGAIFSATPVCYLGLTKFTHWMRALWCWMTRVYPNRHYKRKVNISWLNCFRLWIAFTQLSVYALQDSFHYILL